MSKENINLPKTAFSMKANLQIKEPEILDYWKKIDLYKELRKSNKGKDCLLYTSPSPRDIGPSRMPSSA